MRLKRLLSFFLVFAIVATICPIISTSAAELKLSSSSDLQIYEGRLYGVRPGTDVFTLMCEFPSQNVDIVDANDIAQRDSALVCSGFKVRLLSGTTVVHSLAVVIDGDINADGSVNATDYTALKAILKAQTVQPTGSVFNAADVDSNGHLSITDYIMIKRHIANNYKITRNFKPVIPTLTLFSVVGIEEASARSTLESYGFTVKVTTAYGTYENKGKVISQSPAAGTVVEKGSEVSIVVSLGAEPSSNYTPLNYMNNMKAVWLSQFDMSDALVEKTADGFRTKFKSILQKCVNYGYNTVIVQLRPNGDSFYPSEYYPWSKYVFSYGTGYNTSYYKSYDALAIMVEEAHNLNLSFQAWINPYRLMTTSEIANINDKFLIKQWYNDTSKRGDYIVAYNGYYYLNPAYAETRQLIINGAAEIIKNYKVDGLHFDDYFYPTTDTSFDQKAFTASGTTDRAKFRRNNVDLLVKGIYDMVKSNNPNVIFGISPAGDPTSVRNNQYADVTKWCSSSGYIDYIMPQLYYGFNNSANPFKTVAAEWDSLTTSSSVKLYAGLGLYKASDASNRQSTDGTEWDNYKDIIKRQIQYLDTTLTKYKGIAIFSYGDMTASGASKEVSNMLPALKSFSN